MAISLASDKRLPTERLAVVSYVIVGMISLLLFGFWKLQIIDSDRYAQMAERNRVRSIPIIAPSGNSGAGDVKRCKRLRQPSRRSACSVVSMSCAFGIAAFPCTRKLL